MNEPINYAAETLDVTDLVSFALFQLSNSLGRLAEHDSQINHGVSLPEYRCLSLIASRGDMTVTDVCALLRIDKAWVSRTLAKLKERELIVSRDDPTDARRTVFTATEAGLAKSQALIQQAKARQAAIFKDLTADELETFKEVIGTLQKNADLRLSVQKLKQ